MAATAQTRTPVDLWIVGLVALLYSSFGAYDYVMSHMRDLAYIANSMPGVDPNTALAWMDEFPIYAKVGWVLGVWGGLIASVLLLMRSRFATPAFAASMIGILLSIGYQLALAPALKGAEGTQFEIMPWVVIVAGIALLVYSKLAVKRGLLR
jgi:hypothetical protein